VDELTTEQKEIMVLPAVRAELERAVLAERKRIQGLLAMDQRQFPKEIRAAIDSGASIEDTYVMLMRVIAGRGITLDAIQRDSQAAPFVPATSVSEPAKQPQKAGLLYAARAAIAAARKGAKS
jgi:capsid assembly protease